MTNTAGKKKSESNTITTGGKIQGLDLHLWPSESKGPKYLIRDFLSCTCRSKLFPLTTGFPKNVFKALSHPSFIRVLVLAALHPSSDHFFDSQQSPKKILCQKTKKVTRTSGMEICAFRVERHSDVLQVTKKKKSPQLWTSWIFTSWFFFFQRSTDSAK